MTTTDPDGNLPPYSYVPGGPFPHPIREPGGHSFGHRGEIVEPVDGDDWGASESYRRGIALFNAGYYWEAHEAWEPLWHALGRTGPAADVIRGLIKLAAAGVKVREGQAHGVATHARRAAEWFESAAPAIGEKAFGIDLIALAQIARRIAADPPIDTSAGAVVVVFDFGIELS
jgi:hypothetical protein